MNPNFLIIGPPKTASSSLYYYLSQHPEVFVSPKKEIHFFTWYYDKGFDFYNKFFAKASDQKAAGEASTSYSIRPFAAERIQKFNPKMKIIICLRDPVDRMYSYWKQKFYLMRTENRTFREVVKKNYDLLQKKKLINETDPEVWSEFNTNKSVPSYIIGSMYNWQLNIYKKYFNDNQIKIIFFGDFMKNSDLVLSEIYRFLNISEYPSSNLKKEVLNRTSRLRLNSLYDPDSMLNRLLNVKSLNKMYNAAVPGGLRSKIRKTFYKMGEREIPEAGIQKMITGILRTDKIPGISAEDRKYCIEILKPDIEKLEKELGKDLSKWKTA